MIASDGSTLPALAVVVAWVGFGRARSRRRGVRRPRWVVFAYATAALATVATVVIALRPGPVAERPLLWQRYGFVPAYTSDSPITFDGPGQSVPGYEVVTNDLGMRDRAWDEVPEGHRRGIVIGDSFVLGHGVESTGMLDRFMEQALSEATGDPWEVFNLAQVPAGLWYYVEAVQAMASDIGPEFVVLSVLHFDLQAFELRQLGFRGTPRLDRAWRAFGVDRLVMRHGARTSGLRASTRLGRGAAQRSADRLADLIEHSRQHGYTLVVWQPQTPVAEFDPYRSGDVPHFVDWTDVVRHTDWIPHGREHPGAEWADDPTLGIEGDGHPTARANALIAETLAAEIVPLLRDREPAGATPSETAPPPD